MRGLMPSSAFAGSRSQIGRRTERGALSVLLVAVPLAVERNAQY